jgi:hypothetical protein
MKTKFLTMAGMAAVLLMPAYGSEQSLENALLTGAPETSLVQPFSCDTNGIMIMNDQQLFSGGDLKPMASLLKDKVVLDVDTDPDPDRHFIYAFYLDFAENQSAFQDLTTQTEQRFDLANLPSGVKFQVYGSAGWIDREKGEAASSMWIIDPKTKFNGWIRIMKTLNGELQSELCILGSDGADKLKAHIAPVILEPRENHFIPHL